MDDKLRVQQQANFELVRPNTLGDRLTARGRFTVEHIRAGEVIGKYDFSNAITNEGKNKLLDVMFHAVAAIDA